MNDMNGHEEGKPSQDVFRGRNDQRRYFGRVLASFFLGGIVSIKASLADDGPTDPKRLEEDGVQIERVSISPDGKIVAFEYLHPGRGRSLGLWEWQTNQVRAIPPPLGKAVRDGSFTPDGKHLLAIALGRGVNHLVRIDLDTLLAVELMQIDSYWLTPIQQPGAEKVLFVAEYPCHLRLLDLKTGESTAVLQEQAGFKYLITTPYFISPNTIMFGAKGPMDQDLHRRMVALKRRETDTIAYRMPLDGPPEIILADVGGSSSQEVGISSFSASADGKTLAFISLSKNLPKNENNQYNLEIFTMSNGVLRQRTDLRSHMGYAAMSADAGAVVFGSKLDRNGPRIRGHSFYVIDIRTGAVTPKHLAELLAGRSDFGF